jgi:hypothetical protein
MKAIGALGNPKTVGAGAIVMMKNGVDVEVVTLLGQTL